MDKTRRRILKTSLLGTAAIASGCSMETTEQTGVSGTTAFGTPLKILILGGTGFIGPHMVREGLRRGHVIELFNRGRTNSELFPALKLYKGCLLYTSEAADE